MHSALSAAGHGAADTPWRAIGSDGAGTEAADIGLPKPRSVVYIGELLQHLVGLLTITLA